MYHPTTSVSPEQLFVLQVLNDLNASFTESAYTSN